MRTIADNMTEELVVVDSSVKVVDAIDLMREKNVGAVLVHVEAINEIIGIFTERDIVRKIDFRNAQIIGELKVSEVMTSELKTIDAHETTEHATQIMKEFSIRHLPVKKDNEIIGIVSIRDILYGNK